MPSYLHIFAQVILRRPVRRHTSPPRPIVMYTIYQVSRCAYVKTSAVVYRFPDGRDRRRRRRLRNKLITNGGARRPGVCSYVCKSVYCAFDNKGAGRGRRQVVRVSAVLSTTLRPAVRHRQTIYSAHALISETPEVVRN